MGKSDLIEEMWKGTDYNLLKFMDLCEAEDGSHPDVLWSTHTWNRSVFLDSVKKEEEVEKNKAQLQMEEKLKAKGAKGLSAKDLEFMNKFKIKQKQLALRKIQKYSK